MNRQSKSRGRPRSGRSETLSAHHRSGSSPENEATNIQPIEAEKSYAEIGEVVTISAMPASKEYVKALQIKRSERVRPKVKLPLVPATDASNISYIFDHIKVAKSRIASSNAPLSVAIATLDDGRISFADAIKFFSWDDSTRLECKVQAGALVITAIPQGELRLANSRGVTKKLLLRGRWIYSPSGQGPPIHLKMFPPPGGDPC